MKIFNTRTNTVRYTKLNIHGTDTTMKYEIEQSGNRNKWNDMFAVSSICL